jgi:hypothetical protein
MSHKNLDWRTGDCLDCGATRIQIDDNLSPICEKIEGPHRLAIIAIKQALHNHRFAAEHYRWCQREAEEKTIEFGNEAIKHEKAEYELSASLKILLGEPRKILSLEESIIRLRAVKAY